MNLGKWKNSVQRMMFYYSLIGIAINIAIFLKLYSFKWWYLLVIPCAFLIYFLDFKKIFSEEQDYLAKKSKTLKDTHDMVKYLYEKEKNDNKISS